MVNSGNANAFTGKKGRESTKLTAAAAAKAVDCKPGEVFLASTGVIGEPLDAGSSSHLLADMTRNAVTSRWQEAASAIMTTDSSSEGCFGNVLLVGVPVTINGIARAQA